MALCVAGGAATVKLAISLFTLGWTHTIEHVPWEEDWQVAGEHLILKESRIKGSGAGMEPPPEARLAAGWYVWHPDEIRRQIVLRRAPQAGDWRLCFEDSCHPLGTLVDADPVTLTAC